MKRLTLKAAAAVGVAGAGVLTVAGPAEAALSPGTLTVQAPQPLRNGQVVGAYFAAPGPYDPNNPVPRFVAIDECGPGILKNFPICMNVGVNEYDIIGSRLFDDYSYPGSVEVFKVVTAPSGIRHTCTNDCWLEVVTDDSSATLLATAPISFK